ncbi:unnamed protein product [Didymodactylos carnosus]|uniref:Uncharacterized protein n=1 Tax=Didymodactylos carnosus TaxID=1234261 RepID=A0A815KKT2_9BILA|nr:unnamed protein product [Didymodactylos carnosus]CAF1391146.1 unnamed protein product [Didymodactylos carnosus]CAF3802385.1 unnamed protein product [Didymodactylos carnosus]CAF4285716.1 unnamed protein product [Didymodactylos carnosus]
MMNLTFWQLYGLAMFAFTLAVLRKNPFLCIQSLKDLDDCINMSDSKATVFDERLHQMAIFRDWIVQMKISDLLSAYKDWIQVIQKFEPINQVPDPFRCVTLLFAFAIMDGLDGNNNVSEWKRLFIDRNNSEKDDDFVRNWCEQHEEMSTETALIDSLMICGVGLKTVNDYLNRLCSSAIDESLAITQNNNFGLLIRIWDVLITCRLFSLRRGELMGAVGNTMKELLEKPHITALMSSVAATRTKEKEKEEAIDKAIRDGYQEEERQYLDGSILVAAIQESLEQGHEEH